MVNETAAAHNCKPGEVRFTRREIRDFTNWSDSQLKLHCQRLSEMEYLLIHGGSRGHLLQYELLWDGSGDGAHLCGLIEPGEKVMYDSRKSGSAAGKSGLSLPHVGAKSDPEKQAASRAVTGVTTPQVGVDEKALFRQKKKTVHRSHNERHGNAIRDSP